MLLSIMVTVKKSCPPLDYTDRSRFSRFPTLLILLFISALPGGQTQNYKKYKTALTLLLFSALDYSGDLR